MKRKFWAVITAFTLMLTVGVCGPGTLVCNAQEDAVSIPSAETAAMALADEDDAETDAMTADSSPSGQTAAEQLFIRFDCLPPAPSAARVMNQPVERLTATAAEVPLAMTYPAMTMAKMDWNPLRFIRLGRLMSQSPDDSPTERYVRRIRYGGGIRAAPAPLADRERSDPSPVNAQARLDILEGGWQTAESRVLLSLILLIQANGTDGEPRERTRPFQSAIYANERALAADTTAMAATQCQTANITERNGVMHSAVAGGPNSFPAAKTTEPLTVKRAWKAEPPGIV